MSNTKNKFKVVISDDTATVQIDGRGDEITKAVALTASNLEDTSALFFMRAIVHLHDDRENENVSSKETAMNFVNNMEVFFESVKKSEDEVDLSFYADQIIGGLKC